MSVVAESLSWQAGGRQILQDVSLRAEPGETLGLIGPNGSGKSSLLRLLAGLRRPGAGRVEIDGQDIARLSRRDMALRVALVQQQSTTEANVTARDVVRLGRTPHRGALAGWTAADEEAVAQALAGVGMQHAATRIWRTLSGGERQRIQIARALAQKPSVLFLDEPTNHLDIEHQIAILRLVRDLRLTSVVALHDLNHAATFCDRIVVLQKGRHIAAGTPDEVLTEDMLARVFSVAGRVRPSPYRPGPEIHFLVDAPEA
ncbi:ABC transporter ATP-binding protein [Pseudoroseicyclus aestuarii]|uniref:Iron complex transport system ATP-binding protein n=1 Tax=Pseudoroseicyclus aestuarii TaxID=1795041 RepID=A0A318T5V0_9RHOB|nr:ABC transporter ATP-binding protein [Pseudoroseicyclus aestuarii]PYE83738.1 iron complex transport system ATP-binding protein [Pseudoroseicyclus aestuarii]